MSEIRNSDKKLVCTVDDTKKIIEIIIKGCVTQITVTPDGKFEVVNTRKAA